MAKLKLSKTLARKLAMQLFGTAKGLTQSESFPGRYEMRFGQLGIEFKVNPEENTLIAVEVCMDVTEGQTYYYYPDSLERDMYAEKREAFRDKQERLTCWVDERGPERCKAEIDKIASRYD